MLFRTAFLAAVTLSIISHIGFAQTPPSETAHPTPGGQVPPLPSAQPPTLATALPQIRFEPGHYALAVGAADLRLPEGTVPPLEGLSGIADAFGLISRRFGTVTALAPPSLTLLNTDLHDPQIYDGMSTGDALKLLCGTLTDPQWAALTGERGLGSSDLSSDAQRSLFMACLGTNTLKVRPDGAHSSADEIDLTTDLPQARLRLGCTSQIQLPVSDHEWIGNGTPDSNTGAPHYSLDRSAPQSATLYGNVVKTEVPNAPKRGDLDFKISALQTSIPLIGLKTVGDLIYRIGSVTKVELYVDPHYADKGLTLVRGPAPATGEARSGDATETPSAPAADLLRALAFCLTATYRQVGPAYVLTDDVMGLGVRREILSDFADRARQMLRKPLDDAGDAFLGQYGVGNLHAFGGGDQAPTEAQRKKGQKDEFSADTPGQYLRLTLADLTPTQQAAARAAAEAGAKQELNGDMQHPPSLDGTLLLVTTPKLELLVPSLPGSIDMGAYDLYDLFRPSQKMMDARMEARRKADEGTQKAAPPKPAAPAPSPPTLAQVLLNVPRRAVLVDARTPDEIDAAVTAMKTVGLNQLWLPVFQEGHTRIPGTPLTDPKSGIDVLAEALRVTKGTGIAVFPVLDLLTWGADAPTAMQDLTLRGDNSAQTVLREAKQNAATSEGSVISISTAQKRLAVSPFSGDVRQALLSVVRAVGAVPGIAGIVWRETAPSGYASDRTQQADPMGYSVDGRLAFLRTWHTDPVDLGGGGQADTSLPNWDGQYTAGDLSDTWNKFRVGADEDLLRALLMAWPQTGADGGVRRVFVQQRRDSWQGDWFGSWDGPRATLPAFHPSWEHQQGDPTYPDDPVRQAKAQSRLALLHVDRWAASTPQQLASYLSEQMKKPWDGFVLVYDGDGVDLKDLQTLAADLHPSASQDPPSRH